MRRRNGLRLAVATAVSCGLVALAGTGTFSAFTSQTDNPGSVVTAANDLRAPTVSASVVAKSSGGSAGFVRQGGTYHVYANVSDAGAPPSGVASVTADVSSVTTGQTAVALAAGSFTVDGVTYDRRSAQLTADGSLSEGSKAYSLTSTDNEGNTRTQTGFSVTVDNTQPGASDIQSANGAATVGRAQTGDTITYTFSEPVEPASILSGWNGASTGVVVRLVNNGLLGLGNDEVVIYNPADSAQLPLGTLDLGGSGYIGGLFGGEIGRFGATGTASTMVMSGSTVTITLGTASGQGAMTSGANTTVTWAPSATPTDRAGNGATTTSATESGAADKEF